MKNKTCWTIIILLLLTMIMISTLTEAGRSQHGRERWALNQDLLQGIVSSSWGSGGRLKISWWWWWWWWRRRRRWWWRWWWRRWRWFLSRHNQRLKILTLVWMVLTIMIILRIPCSQQTGCNLYYLFSSNLYVEDQDADDDHRTHTKSWEEPCLTLRRPRDCWQGKCSCRLALGELSRRKTRRRRMGVMVVMVMVMMVMVMIIQNKTHIC